MLRSLVGSEMCIRDRCKSEQCAMLPYLLVSIMMGASMQYLIDEGKFNLDAYFDAAENMILNFIK